MINKKVGFELDASVVEEMWLQLAQDIDYLRLEKREKVEKHIR